MKKTCKGCKQHGRVMLRGQWVNLCRRTGATAPMVWCRFGIPRFSEATNAKTSPAPMPAELL